MSENKEFNVDEALNRLEEINLRLAGSEITLKESLSLYQEGVELAAKCKEQLIGIEKELQIINSENLE